MKQKYPEYENCITNLANSITEKFGIYEEGRQGLAILKPYMEKDYKNIVVILLCSR